MGLSQSGDSIVLGNSTLTIDECHLEQALGFAVTAGASTSLEPGYIDFTLNDDGAGRCDGTVLDWRFGNPGLPKRQLRLGATGTGR